MPKGLTSIVRTLTMNIATDMAMHRDYRTALFATGAVLFVFIMLKYLYRSCKRR